MLCLSFMATGDHRDIDITRGTRKQKAVRMHESQGTKLWKCMCEINSHLYFSQSVSQAEGD